MSSHRLVIASCIFIAMSTAVAAQQDKPTKPKDGPLGMKFVPLPKATFYIGWNGEKGSAKKTEIKEDFEIAIQTVTQEQWEALMGDNLSSFSRNGDGRNEVVKISNEDLKSFPVERVSWENVQKFVAKLNKREKGRGYMYRLPTEVEWEFACRGGTTSEVECSYHFYLDAPTNDLSSKQANFDGSSPFGKAPKGPNLGRPTKVGSYAPNKIGLYDMHGNVWQWTDSSDDSKLVLRGGSFGLDGSYCRASFRRKHAPTEFFINVGFRLARVATLVQPAKPEPGPTKPKDGPLGMKFVPLPKAKMNGGEFCTCFRVS